MKGRDSLMKKLLSAPNYHGMGYSANTSYGEAMYSASNSASEMPEENCTKLSKFLSFLAKESGQEINMVMMDHAYSKPGDWSPENTYLKPTKKLFTFNFSPTENFRKGKSHIDVEEEPGPLFPPYNKEVANRLMLECESFIKSMRCEDKGDDWEDKIDKSYWTTSQSRLFSKFVRALHQDRLARLVSEGSPVEAVKRRVIADATARRMRQLLASVNWETRLLHWLHATLIDSLSNAYLAAYFDALQVLRAKVPKLIERLVGGSTRGVAAEALNIILKHPWDPVLECLNENKPRRLPGNPILLVVPSHPVLGTPHSNRMTQWESYLSALGTVVTVVLKAGNETSKANLPTCLDQMLCAARMKTAQVRSEYPGKPVILVGWNAGATIACQVALLEQVQAVVCLGFSVHTIEGKRGETNDSLLDIRCPVFFVIGEHSANAHCADIEEIREKMRVETGLVVVGSADDQLRMSKRTKFRGGVTQTMVDYCVMDEVAEFLGTLLITPRPQLRPLYNHNLNTINSNTYAAKMEGKRKQPFNDVSTPAVKRSRTEAPSQTTNSSTYPATTTMDTSPKSSLSTLPTYVPLGNTGNARGGRQKSRLTAMQKLQSSQESKWMSQKVGSDQGTGSNGISVNIGTLGSLTPHSPLKLGHGAAGSEPNQAECALGAPNLGAGSNSLTIQGGLVSSGGRGGTRGGRGGARAGRGGYNVQGTGRGGLSLQGIGRGGIGVQGTGRGGLSVQGAGSVGLTVQGKPGQVMAAIAAATSGKTVPENQLTSLSSLLQSGTARIVVSSPSNLLFGQATSLGTSLGTSLTTTTAGQQATSQNNGTRIRTTSGRVVDLSKLTVLTSGATGITSAASKNVLGTTAGGNVVMLTGTNGVGRGVRIGGQQTLVTNQSITVTPQQRSYTVVPKISVPSLKLNNDQQMGHAGTKLSGYAISTGQSRIIHQNEGSSMIAKQQDNVVDTLTPDKILELPIIFAKEGDNLFLDTQVNSGVGESSASIPVTTCSNVEASQKVTLGDTISFPLNDGEEDALLDGKSCSSVGNMPNVYIIRSNRGRGRGTRRYVPKAQRVVQTTTKANDVSVNQAQGVKYTKIILTNKNSPLKIGELDVQGKSIQRFQQGITRVNNPPNDNIYGTHSDFQS